MVEVLDAAYFGFRVGGLDQSQASRHHSMPVFARGTSEQWGIKPGDLLHAVDTASNVDKLSVNDVSKELQGTPGSAVVLTV